MNLNDVLSLNISEKRSIISEICSNLHKHDKLELCPFYGQPDSLCYTHDEDDFTECQLDSMIGVFFSRVPERVQDSYEKLIKEKKDTPISEDESICEEVDTPYKLVLEYIRKRESEYYDGKHASQSLESILTTMYALYNAAWAIGEITWSNMFYSYADFVAKFLKIR